MTRQLEHQRRRRRSRRQHSSNEAKCGRESVDADTLAATKTPVDLNIPKKSKQGHPPRSNHNDNQKGFSGNASRKGGRGAGRGSWKGRGGRTGERGSPLKHGHGGDAAADPNKPDLGFTVLRVTTVGDDDDDLWDNLAHQHDRAAASGTLPLGSEPRHLQCVEWEQLGQCRSFLVLALAAQQPSENTAATQELAFSLSKFAGPVRGNAEFQGFVNYLLNENMGVTSEAAREALVTGKGDQLQDLSAKAEGMKVEQAAAS